ncbi:histidine kinase [Marinomonas sp. TW1]|nr:histidine kinase [Marinomonas sp. TW1]
MSFNGFHWSHWAVISLSLLLTLGAWYFSNQQAEQKTKAQFDFQAEQIVSLVQERMEKYEEALWAGVAALHTLPNNMARADWRIFANSLKVEDRFPGINGIGVIHYLEQDKLNSYLAWQRETTPNFTLHPAHTKNEYWPITYIEPQVTNQAAVGLDMAHEINRYSAAKKARDTGKATITAPITLVQDAKRTPGFLFYAPWYGDRQGGHFYGDQNGDFLGLVYSPFIMKKLMGGVLTNSNRQVNFSIHDSGEALYSELNESSENYDDNPLYSKQIEINMYGRDWLFTVQSSSLFRAQNTQNQPLIILAGGIVIDSLLLIIFILLSRANHRAVSYADKVTQDLKQQKEELEIAHEDLQLRNQELEEANKDLDQFAFVASHDLKAPLRGISQLAQWIEEDLRENFTSQTREFMDLLQGRIQRLEKLLDALLSYSRIGREQNTFEQFHLGARVTELFSLINANKAFIFECEDNVGEMNTLAVPLELVLRNLLSNAIKHHDKGQGTIQFKAEKQSDHYRICVIDDGPGIPLQYQEKVFDLFKTLKPRDEVESSGLGLSMVKKILDRYECHYQISSNGERGTSFEFEWPFETALREE